MIAKLMVTINTSDLSSYSTCIMDNRIANV